MMHSNLNYFENESLILDINELKVVNGNRVVNEDYTINVNENEIDIKLTGKYLTCELILGKLKGNINLSIDASSYNLIISESLILVKRIHIKALHTVIEDDCRIHAYELEQTSEKFDVYGDVKLNVMKSRFSSKGYGLTNAGKLIIQESYYQRYGSVINSATFKASNLVLESVDIFWNKPDAHWEVSNTYRLSCESAHFDGIIYNTNMIVVHANNIHILSSVQFRKCGNILLTAQQALKLYEHANIDSLSFSAQANHLFIQGHITAHTQLSLVGQTYSIVNDSAVLTAQNINLRGLDIFIFGKLIGQVSFEESIRHLYLASTSSIEQCHDFKVMSYITEVYGKISTDRSYINSDLAIETRNTTEFKSPICMMVSNHITLAGLLEIESFQLKAVEQLMMENNARVCSKSVTSLAGQAVLRGLIDSYIEVQAGQVTNDATINNQQRTVLTAKKLLVNTRDSNIQTDQAIFDVENGSLLHQGKVAAHTSVNGSAPNLHFTKESVIAAGKTTMSGQTIYLGGNIDCTETLHAQSFASIHFLTGNHLRAPEAILQAEDDITGSLNLASKNASVVAKQKTDLLCGTIANTEKMIVAAKSVLVDTRIDTRELVVADVKEERSDDTDLLLGPDAKIKATLYHQNFANFASFGQLVMHQGYQDSMQSIHYFQSSETFFSKVVINQTKTFVFSGKLGSSFLDDKEVGFYVEADYIAYQPTTITDTLLPIRNDANTVSYAGTFNASALLTKANRIIFSNNCVITDKSQDVVIEGRSASATVEIAKGSHIGSQRFLSTKIKSITIGGTLTSQQIIMNKIEDLLIAIKGQLGNMESKIQLDIDRVTLQGRLEGMDIQIKCDDYFFLDGMHGEARIRATKASVTTTKYLDLFGVTEAQQLNVSSYLCLVFGFRLVNWNVSNSIISIRLLPQVVHLEFLKDAIDDIRLGRISLFNLQSFQYSIQIALTLLQNIIPRWVSSSINLVTSSIFLINNIIELKKLCQQIDFDNCRDVDLLPFLVGIKNTLISTGTIAQSAVTLAEESGIPVRDKIADFFEYLGGDLGKDICDLLHIRQTNKDPGAHPSDTNNKDNTKDNKGNGKNSNTEPKPPAETPMSAYDILTKLVMPITGMFAPFNMEDSIFSLKLASPILTGTSTERSLFELTCVSPVAGFARNIFSTAIITFDPDAVYTLNLTSYALYLGSSITIPEVVNIKAEEIQQRSGTVIRSTLGVLQQSHVKPLDFKTTKGLTFICDSADDMRDFFELYGEYSVFRPEKADERQCTITYEMKNYDFKFYHDRTWDWGVVFKGKSIYVAKYVFIESKGEMLGLISTEGSVICFGDLKSKKIIFAQSADKVYFYKMNSNSVELYIIAYNDVQLIKSHNHCKVGAVISQRKNVEVLEGTLKADEFLYVSARRKLIDNCTVSNSHHHGKPDKKYKSGTIEGGTGADHQGVGLYAEAETLDVTASNVGAVGNVILNINHAVKAEALHNTRIHKVKHHTTWYGKHSKEVVITEHIKRPKFYSKRGKVVIVSKRDVIETFCALFDSPGGTLLISRQAPIFKEMLVRTTSIRKDDYFFIPVVNKLHIEDEYYSAVITKTDMFGVICKYGDCYADDITFDAGLVITDCAGGRFYARNHNIQVYDRTTYLTLSLNIGPLRVQYTFNPDVRHHTSYGIDDSLVNLIKRTKKLHDDADAVSTLINLANVIVGKGRALLNGDYLDAAGVNLGASATYTTTETLSESKGRHYVNVGAWVDSSRDGVLMASMDGYIGRFSTTSNQFVVQGTTVNYRSNSTSVTGGISYHPILNRVSFSGGLSGSTASGVIALPANLHIKQFIAWGDVDILAENACIKIDEAHGHIRNIEATSKFDTVKSFSLSLSGNTSGSASFSLHTNHSHEIKSMSFVEIKSHSDDCQIDHVKLVGAELRGDGTKGIPTSSIENIEVAGEHHEFGFSASVEFKEGPPISHADYENSRNGHGVKVSVDTPMSLFSLFGKRQQPAVTPNQDNLQVEDSAAVDEETQIVLMPASASRKNQYYIPVYNKEGDLIGYVMSDQDKQLTTSHESEEDEHHGLHLHFPTPGEVGEIVNIPSEFFDEILYRGDDLPPEKAFSEGIKARNQKMRLVRSDQQLVEHVTGVDGGGSKNSTLVSTSREMEIARDFPYFVEDHGYMKSYVYVVKNRYGTIDVNLRLAEFQGDANINAFFAEHEVAFPYKISNNEIMGYYVNERVYISNEHKPTYLISDEMIKNPNYGRYVSWSEFNVKGVSYIVTAYSVVNDANEIYQASKHGFFAELYMTLRVGGRWAGAAYLTHLAIKKAPMLLFRNPVVATVTTITSSIIGANVEDLILEKAINPAANYLWDKAYLNAGQNIFLAPPKPTETPVPRISPPILKI